MTSWTGNTGLNMPASLRLPVNPVIDCSNGIPALATARCQTEVSTPLEADVSAWCST